MQDKQPSIKQTFFQPRSWNITRQIEQVMAQLCREVKDTVADLKEGFGALSPISGQPVRVPVVVNGKATVRRKGRSR